MGAGCVCVYVCILWCFLLCVHVCESVCALASLSHMCGACAVSAGLGEEELGDSRAQRRLRQAGRQQAGGLPGRLGPQPKAAQVGGWGGSGVFGPGLYMLPQCPCSTMCSHPPMQAWPPLLLQLLPFPIPRPLSSPSSCGSP